MIKKSIKVLVLVLLFASLLTSVAYAEELSPRASAYIDSYRAYIYSPSYGNAQVWVEIKGNVTSDKVGATSVTLQRSDDGVNWSNVTTFYSSSYTNLMATDTISNTTHVDRSVTGGYYRAGVNFYVEKDGGSDSRYYITDPVWVNGPAENK